jgi:Protein of unknown function (DUF2924)
VADELWAASAGASAEAPLLRLLAYRIQADALGDLDPATVRYLNRLVGSEANASTPLSGEGATRPGTVLVREWNGACHRVMALDEGFAWEGGTYKSLSQVARAITGTRWNGPRFFGLREGTR